MTWVQGMVVVVVVGAMLLVGCTPHPVSTCRRLITRRWLLSCITAQQPYLHTSPVCVNCPLASQQARPARPSHTCSNSTGWEHVSVLSVLLLCFAPRHRCPTRMTAVRVALNCRHVCTAAVVCGTFVLLPLQLLLQLERCYHASRRTP